MKELDSYLQLHHISEDEAIKVAVLHFRGKAHAWWIFEYCSLKNTNTSSYARFIETLVGRFDGKLPKTYDQEKLKRTKTLHVMEETIKFTPLQKTMGGADILHYTFPGARHPVHILEQEGMGISFSQEDPTVEMLPIHIEEDEGNSVVTSRAHLVPHAEGGGAHAPIGGILVVLQEVPQDLIHGGPSTISEQHDCATLQLEGGGRQEEQHHLMRGTHPSLFQRASENRRQTVLHCESKGKVSQPYEQSTLDIDVSLYGGIPLGRPLDL